MNENEYMDLFIPRPISFDQAARELTHLGVGAHQDDLEIMALHGILECYNNTNQYFGGIICTHGGGSPRTGDDASCSDEEMILIRRQEQREAARLGHYSFIAQLGLSSPLIQNPTSHRLTDTLYELLVQLHPQVIYTHHPLDKHPTHRAVCRSLIDALRRLPVAQHPKQLFGGEVWRSLDWVTDSDKIPLDVSAHRGLAEQLIAVFDSQISRGKRYDLATLGRMRANATYATPSTIDQATHITYAIDLKPLLENRQLTLNEFALGFVDRFYKQVEEEILL